MHIVDGKGTNYLMELQIFRKISFLHDAKNLTGATSVPITSASSTPTGYALYLQGTCRTE